VERIVTVILVLSTVVGCGGGAIDGDGSEAANLPLLLIYDGDLGPDPCDFTTLSMLHEYHERGRIELLGVIGSVPDPHLASTYHIYNRLYGHDVPVGAYRTEEHDVPYSDEVRDWYEAAISLSTSANPNEVILEKYGGRGAGADEVHGSVELYRKLLAEAENHSVTVFVAGQVFNLPALLASGADQYSPLGGEELLRSKVHDFVFMGGAFPDSHEESLYPFTSGAEWNWWALGAEGVTRAAVQAIVGLGRPVTYVGQEVGAEVLVGQEIIHRLGRDHPTSEAYFLYNPTSPDDGGALLDTDNPAYDDVALYHIVEGGLDHFFGRVFGRVEVDGFGANTWLEGGTQESYLTVIPGMADELAQAITDRVTGVF
jgi:hypothetical protein